MVKKKGPSDVHDVQTLEEKKTYPSRNEIDRKEKAIAEYNNKTDANNNDINEKTNRIEEENNTFMDEYKKWLIARNAASPCDTCVHVRRELARSMQRNELHYARMEVGFKTIVIVCGG